MGIGLLRSLYLDFGLKGIDILIVTICVSFYKAFIRRFITTLLLRCHCGLFITEDT
jgi:hypothetical protein